MPLSLSEDTAQLVGVVSVDEAEPLAQWLRDRVGGSAGPKVGLARCTALHTAALQALLAARPVVVAPPTDPFLVTWVLPLLAAAGGPSPDAEYSDAEYSDAGYSDADSSDADDPAVDDEVEVASESVADEAEVEVVADETEVASEADTETVEDESELGELEDELSLEQAEALWALAQAEEAEAEARALAGADLADVGLDESLVIPAGFAALGEPDGLAGLDELDGLELDESLVIPAGLAALAEPEAELL